MAAYVLGIDQSTQGTKALVFSDTGRLLARADLPHRQIIDEKGWVEHDPEEIRRNTLQVVRMVVEKAGINAADLKAVGISNQRETAMVWDRKTGKPIYNAIVWQCARGAAICEGLQEHADLVRSHTGLQLSPYFSAAKLAWVLRNVSGAQERAERGELCCGTMDSWLVYCLTGGKSHRTDYSNASRTQLMDIRKLCWDGEICKLFGIPTETLPEITDSDGFYGETDFDGFLPKHIPIHGVLGDSHGALFGQGCLERGMVKATYGTGSSIMMNIGEIPAYSSRVVTSLAWSMGGKVHYVLEGNINYTGAVISWLKNDLHLIDDPGETQHLAETANPQDTTYLVPAFTGLGAPYWDSDAKAAIVGMGRTTGKAELVKAAVESIAYQIHDVVDTMQQESGIPIAQLRVDGGPTKNQYLMQFQSDISAIPVSVPSDEELSGIGAAYAAGIGAGLYRKEELFSDTGRTIYRPTMEEPVRKEKYRGWQKAVAGVLTNH